MPYELKAPKAVRSPYWRVRGTEFGIYLDRSTQTSDRREAAPVMLSALARKGRLLGPSHSCSNVRPLLSGRRRGFFSR